MSAYKVSIPLRSDFNIGFSEVPDDSEIVSIPLRSDFNDTNTFFPSTPCDLFQSL